MRTFRLPLADPYGAWHAPRMFAEPPKSAARGQFVGVILMSVGLGTLIITAFDKWLRGESFVWWLLLSVLFVISIITVSMTVLKRIS
jgi:hypothetical protein